MKTTTKIIIIILLSFAVATLIFYNQKTKTDLKEAQLELKELQTEYEVQRLETNLDDYINSKNKKK